MSNKKVLVWILGFLTLIICSFYYFQSNRFVISNEKGNSSYKIDQWTGDTWRIFGDYASKVETESDEDETDSAEEIAIRQVRWGKNIDDYENNHDLIVSRIEVLEGELLIQGWDAEEVNDQTYLVSFKYEHQESPNAYYFEYNSKIDIVRFVNDDHDLMFKYGVGIFAPPTEEELRILYD